MPVRLIATDLDGTLVRSDGSISARTQHALVSAEAAGIAVVFVTGRPLRWAADVFDHVGSHGHAIVSNGALLWDVARSAAVEVHPIEPLVGAEVARQLVAAVPGTRFAVETLDGIRLEPGFMAERRLPENLPYAPLVTLFETAPVKMLAHHPDIDPQEFWDRAETLVGDRTEITWSSSTALLEMSAPGVTKAAALARFCDARGITAADVVAFGDMPNDLGMLAWAGLSYAMANAETRVLQAADRVTATNDDDGVAQVLEEIVGVGDLPDAT